MAILPSIQHYIASEETQFEAPVAESMAQNMGEAINYLNDLLLNNFVEFSTPGGPFPWVVPPSVTKLLIIAAGGGGGGGGGYGPSVQASIGGGGGGGSLHSVNFFKTTPGDLLNIYVGVGGGGGAININGGNGGSSIVTGPNINLSVLGGAGGEKGQFINADDNYISNGGLSVRPGAWYTRGGSPTGVKSFGIINSILSEAGQTGVFGLGGAAGTTSTIFGGGGGGGGGFANGGAGGNGAPFVSGTVGLPGGLSAGGGGGTNGKAGGAGGNGFVYLTWY